MSSLKVQPCEAPYGDLRNIVVINSRIFRAEQLIERGGDEMYYMEQMKQCFLADFLCLSSEYCSNLGCVCFKQWVVLFLVLKMKLFKVSDKSNGKKEN